MDTAPDADFVAHAAVEVRQESVASSVWSTAFIQVMRGLPNNIVIPNVCCVAKLARKVRLATDMVLGKCISQDQQSDLSKDMQV